jgi:hypothetical protein
MASAEEIVVVNAIRRSFETNSIAGNSLNIGPNPFTPGLTGTFDLLKAATLVLNDLEQHRERVAHAAKLEAERARKAAEAGASVRSPT